MDEKKCVQSLDHYEEEDKKEPIGPMAVDDVCWIVNDLLEKFVWERSALETRWPRRMTDANKKLDERNLKEDTNMKVSRINCEICGATDALTKVYECACDPNSAHVFLCEVCKRKYFDSFHNYRGPSLSLLNGIRFPKNLVLAYNTINGNSEKSNKKEATTMQVTYNGFTGELVKLERTSVDVTLRTSIIGMPTQQSDSWNYNLSIYDREKHVTYSFTGVKLEDVKFSGGAVTFGG
mgnify:CR=1 FL=1